MPTQVIKVSQLNRYIKAQLEENPLLGDLLVKGELTSMSRRNGSGHIYFTLSEGDAMLRCIMFARYAERVLSFPAEGDTVIVRGAVTLYERDGLYQLTAYDIQGKTDDRRAAFSRAQAQGTIFTKSYWGYHLSRRGSGSRHYHRDAASQ